MQALQRVARDSRDAARTGRPCPTDSLLIGLAFALRETDRRMRRAGPVRHQSPDGGGTLEMKHSAISHRGFAFTVRGKTYVWESIRLKVRQLKQKHPIFLLLLETPGEITWVDALRAQDALRELWSVMRPVDEPQLDPLPLPRLPLDPPAPAEKPKVRRTWKSVAVVERGEFAYDYCLAVAAELDRQRRARGNEQPLRRRWERERCVIEAQVGPDVTAPAGASRR